MRIELEPAYLLHSRNYRDTSIIADMWTAKYGRIAVIAKGARRRKGGIKHLLIPFTPLLLSCQGRSELKTLVHLEWVNSAVYMAGTALFSGFYLNELLLRLLAVGDAHTPLFARYSETVKELALDVALEPCLREFEWALLQELGYGLDFTQDSSCHASANALHSGKSKQLININYRYSFFPARGFVAEPAGFFSGADLLAIAAQDYREASAVRAAKLIAREALRTLLGDKPLNSRVMYQQLLKGC